MTLDTPNAAKAQIGPIPFFVLPIMLAVLQFAMLNLRAIATARKSVTADEYGLHLGPTLLRRRREDIPWSSARSLVKLDLRNSTMLRPSPMYLLDAGDAIFTWGDSFLKYGAYADPKPGLEIARLIVTRTGLPLRDGTRPPSRWRTCWAAPSGASHRAASRASSPSGTISPRPPTCSPAGA